MSIFCRLLFAGLLAVAHLGVPAKEVRMLSDTPITSKPLPAATITDTTDRMPAAAPSTANDSNRVVKKAITIPTSAVKTMPVLPAEKMTPAQPSTELVVPPEVEVKSEPEKFERSGFFVFERVAIIEAGRTGKVLRLSKELGQRFEQSESLVEMDCLSEHAQIEEMRLLHAEAKIKRKQMIIARQDNKVTLEEMSLADLEVEISLARLNRLRKEIESCAIAAPFAGLVQKVHVREGQNVEFLSPLLDIVSVKSQHFSVAVPSAWLQQIKIGMQFTVYVEALDRNYQVKVLRLGNEVDVVTQTVMVIAEVIQSDATLRIGMHGMAKFNFTDE